MLTKWILPAVFFFSCIPTLLCVRSDQERLNDLKDVLRDPNSVVHSVKIFESFGRPEVEVRMMLRGPDGHGGEKTLRDVNIHYHVDNNDFWRKPTDVNNIRPSQINTRGFFEPTGGRAKGTPVLGLSSRLMTKIQNIVEAAVLKRDEKQQVSYYDALMSNDPNIRVPAKDLRELIKTNHIGASAVSAINLTPTALIQEQDPVNRQDREQQRMLDLQQEDERREFDQAFNDYNEQELASKQQEEREKLDAAFYAYNDLLLGDKLMGDVREREAAQDKEQEHDSAVYDYSDRLLEAHNHVSSTNDRRRSLSPIPEKQTDDTRSRSRSPRESQAERSEAEHSPIRDRLQAAAMWQDVQTKRQKPASPEE